MIFKPRPIRPGLGNCFLLKEFSAEYIFNGAYDRTEYPEIY